MDYKAGTEWLEREDLEERRALETANPSISPVQLTSAEGTMSRIRRPQTWSRCRATQRLSEITLRVVLLEDIEQRADLPTGTRAAKSFWRDLGLHGWSSVANLRDDLTWTLEDYQRRGSDLIPFAEKLLAALVGIDPDCVVWFDHSKWGNETRTLREFDVGPVKASVIPATSFVRGDHARR